MFNYDKKLFKAIQNSNNGQVAEGLTFLYRQKNNIVTCEYAGGDIIQGHLIGLVDEKGIIQMRYHQVDVNGQLMTGKCTSTPNVMANGKIRLHEVWQWTSGDESKGSSILEEA